MHANLFFFLMYQYRSPYGAPSLSTDFSWWLPVFGFTDPQRFDIRSGSSFLSGLFSCCTHALVLVRFLLVLFTSLLEKAMAGMHLLLLPDSLELVPQEWREGEIFLHLGQSLAGRRIITQQYSAVGIRLEGKVPDSLVYVSEWKTRVPLIRVDLQTYCVNTMYLCNNIPALVPY